MLPEQVQTHLRKVISMNKKLVITSALLYGFCTSSVVRAAEPHMVILKDQDISGEVFKRLGLPNQDYCWEQCLKEERCTGTRWGVISGATAGQCQLFTGDLTLGGSRDLKTGDGQKIVVTASKKEAGKDETGI
jgi:hypothetical protein